MAAQTVLLDFSIDSSRISDEVAQKDVVKLLEKGLLEFFPQIKLIFETSTSDGHLCVFSQNDTVYVNARFFNHGIITINIEFFKADAEPPIVNFDVSRMSSLKMLLCRHHVSTYRLRAKDITHSQCKQNASGRKNRILCSVCHLKWVLFSHLTEAYELEFN